jgi:hypothetical protein
MLSSDHRPLYFDFNVLTLFGHPVKGTEKTILRDLQLDNPQLIDGYEAALCQQFENHNVESRVTLLHEKENGTWRNSEELHFNKPIVI